jgi:hypothetical protein
MLNHLNEQEFVQMPLHLQIVHLLNLWANGYAGDDCDQLSA